MQAGERKLNLKRLVLIVLTAIALSVTGLSLVGSFTQTQIQSRLELYQTNLLLRATGELDQPITRDQSAEATPLDLLRGQLLGDRTFSEACKQYAAFRVKAAANADRLVTTLTQSATPDDEPAGGKSLFDRTAQQLRELAAVDLRLGILQARSGDAAAAVKTWEQLAQLDHPWPDMIDPQTFTADYGPIRADLVQLWSRSLANADDQAIERHIRKFLDGWFRDASLARLYRATGRTAELAALEADTSVRSEAIVVKLAAANLLPGLGLLAGIVGLVGLVVQRLLKGSEAILSLSSVSWSVPWGGETIWEVFVLGFFAIGQIVVPLVSSIGLQAIGLNLATATGATQAGIILLRYGLMAAGGVAVLRWAVHRFLPLPEGWFQFDWRHWRWLAWGLGGYCVALPIVIVVSLVNQSIWQGQGGSNPILSIVLENRDPVAITCFFLTASVAAPLFEETLFRGFLLPSLTRYVPTWGAIGLSSLLFALAHLSLSEILPLTALGAVLGLVYARSRNLLASILLHGLWNSGTLASLLLLAGN
jgi:membrane protease YdiL (CAAX protease family)